MTWEEAKAIQWLAEAMPSSYRMPAWVEDVVTSAYVVSKDESHSH